MNKNKNPFIPLTSDAIGKELFHFDKEITKKFLEIILGIKISSIEFLETELPRKSAYDYNLTTDILMLINHDIYLNIELNRTLFDNVKNKSLSYFTKYISLRVKKGEDIKKIKTDVIQVNLNAITKKGELPERTVLLYIKEENKPLMDNIQMKLFDIEKFRDLYYNNNDRNKKTIFLASLSSRNIHEIRNFMNQILNKRSSKLFVRRYLDMCKDPRVISAYEQELANKIIYQDSIENATNNGKNIGFEKGKNIGIKQGRNIGIKQGKNIGIKQGRNIGIKQGKNIGIKEEKTEIAKKMLNENMSHELIIKLTGINKKELNKIINQK